MCVPGAGVAAGFLASHKTKGSNSSSVNGTPSLCSVGTSREPSPPPVYLSETDPKFLDARILSPGRVSLSPGAECALVIAYAIAHFGGLPPR